MLANIIQCERWSYDNYITYLLWECVIRLIPGGILRKKWYTEGLAEIQRLVFESFPLSLLPLCLKLFIIQLQFLYGCSLFIESMHKTELLFLGFRSSFLKSPMPYKTLNKLICKTSLTLPCLRKDIFLVFYPKEISILAFVLK